MTVNSVADEVMSLIDRAETSGARGRAALARAVLPVFATTIFVSAFLLFAVQPMFTRMVLPKLGGTPAVWSIAMLFFQAVLLAGYAYAHWLAGRSDTRRAVAIHLGLMLVVGLATLPIGVASGWARPPQDGEAFWLIGLFAASVGLPFFAVAANGPLLQSWFSRTGHPHADDPYFLYGASNLGSFVALIGYPFVVEPALGLADQSRGWSMGFAALAGLIAASGMAAVLLARRDSADSARPAARIADQPAPTWRERGVWVGLSFVPSALLVAVTAHISTDVAAAPFLWVIPLALFLLTFIITFQRRPILPHETMLRLQPILIGLPVIMAVGGMVFSWPVALTLNLAAFFVSAMVCHGELVRRRPAALHLTDFYRRMSLGGGLGGIAAGLVAPFIFSSVAEYPLLILAALACRPGVWTARPKDWPREIVIGVAITLVACIPAILTSKGTGVEALGIKYGLLLLAVAIMWQRTNDLRLIAIAAATMVAIPLFGNDFGKVDRVRSFYGVHKVAETADGRYRVLFHGTTLHGVQRLGEPGAAPEPLSYYYRGGPMGEAIEAARGRTGTLGRVGIVGLGTGSLACHKPAAEDWRFYEIDRTVAELARGPGARFDFMRTCAPDAPIVIGDARLTLADEPAGAFDLLLIDAFSSDAIPVHLVTAEALATYLEKLRPAGVLVMHISNRNLDLTDPIASTAALHGLKVWRKFDVVSDERAREMKSSSVVVALARDASDLGRLSSDPDWRPVVVNPAVRPWTDDYADVLGALLRRLAK